MKFIVSLLIAYCLCVGIMNISAEQEIDNEMTNSEETNESPSQLVNQDFGKNKTTPPHFLWPDMSFMERILSALLPPFGASARPKPAVQGLPDSPWSVQPTAEPAKPPLIMWRFRFFLLGNNNVTSPHAAEGATEGDTKAVTTETEPRPSPNPTVKMSKNTRRKRNKEERAKQLTKAFPMLSYLNTRDRIYSDGKDGIKKPTNGVIWSKMNGISHNFNKTRRDQDCYNYRRLTTYVWTLHWNSVIVHAGIVLGFILFLRFVLSCCVQLTNSPRVAVKRVKVTTNNNKFKGLEVCMC